MVGSAIFGLGLEYFSLNYQIFNFFPSDQIIFELGQKVPGSKVQEPGPLFLASQKYALISNQHPGDPLRTDRQTSVSLPVCPSYGVSVCPICRDGP